MSVERRELIQILGAGLVTATSAQSQSQHARHQRGKPASPAAAYVPRALTREEYATVDKLAEMLLPADETSGGAHDAGAARYIDIVLLYGDQTTLAAWKDGIRLVESRASRYGGPFTSLEPSQANEIMREMAGNESDPKTGLEQFFVRLKRLTIEAYYLSATGKGSLGYKGDTAIASFPGCTHAEHRS